ncbi:hypothetical protein KAS08_04505 [Candidatus Pacearchaeota archaeon]|nr:hypothetical protein [Candidatus Pacearchaeota archaeon]
MAKEALILGAAGIVLGVSILIKNHSSSSIVVALIPTIIGIALILLRKEENKIEQRKDFKKSNHGKRKK